MKLLLLLSALAVLVLNNKRPEPSLVIVCATGGVHMGDGAIAFGNNCVLHDRRGGASAESISVYDSSAGGP